MFPCAQDCLPAVGRRVGFVTTRIRAYLFPCTPLHRYVRTTFRSEALRSFISRSGPPPQSSFASSFLPPSFRTEAHLPRVSALIATSPIRVHSHRHIPGACYVPPSGFLGLSAVYSAVRLVSLFHPTTTSRVLSRSGASLLVQPFSPHRGDLPPCRFTRSCSPTEVGCHSYVPRLRGLAPHEVALLSVWFYPPRSSLPSSGYSSPPGVSLRLAARFPVLLHS